MLKDKFNSDIPESIKDMCSLSGMLSICLSVCLSISFLDIMLKTEQIRQTTKFFNYWHANVMTNLNCVQWNDSVRMNENIVNKTMTNINKHSIIHYQQLRQKQMIQFNGNLIMDVVNSTACQINCLPHQIFPTVDGFCYKDGNISDAQPWCTIHVGVDDNFFHQRFDNHKYYINQIMWLHPPHNHATIKKVCRYFMKREMRGYLCIPDWTAIKKLVTFQFQYLCQDIVYVRLKQQLKRRLWIGTRLQYNCVVCFIDCRGVCDASKSLNWPK